MDEMRPQQSGPDEVGVAGDAKEISDLGYKFAFMILVIGMKPPELSETLVSLS